MKELAYRQNTKLLDHTHSTLKMLFYRCIENILSDLYLGNQTVPLILTSSGKNKNTLRKVVEIDTHTEPKNSVQEETRVKPTIFDLCV